MTRREMMATLMGGAAALVVAPTAASPAVASPRFGLTVTAWRQTGNDARPPVNPYWWADQE